MASEKLINPNLRVVSTPFVRLLLRHGISYFDFMAITRGQYIENAARDFQIAQKKQTVARVSVRTRLTCHELINILEIYLSEPPASNTVSFDGQNLVSLSCNGYVPSATGVDHLSVAMRSVADLISPIEYNYIQEGTESLLQLPIEYTDVLEDDAEEFRIINKGKSKEVLLYLDSFPATQHRHTNPTLGGTGSVRTDLSKIYFSDEKPPLKGEFE